MTSPSQHWTLPHALQWLPAPASLPEGSVYAILEGDPSQPGLFTARFRLPAGTRLAPHWHPLEERATLLSGKLRMGVGEVFDESSMTEIGTHGFLLVPPRKWHYAIFDEATEIQLTGNGPWEVIYAPAS